MQDFKNHASKRETSLRLRPKKYDIQYGKKKLRISPQSKQNFRPIPASRFKRKSPVSRPRSLSFDTTFLINSWAKILIGLGTMFFLIWLLTGIILLSISYSQQPFHQIHMKGYSFLTPTRIYQITGIDPNSNFGEIDIYKVAQRLNQHPVIAQAQIRKLLPDHLSISLQERRPYAHLKMGDTYYLIDRKQHPLQIIPAAYAKQHPILTGIENVSVQLGKPILSPSLEKGIQLLDSLRESGIAGHDIAKLDISDPLNLKVKLRSPSLVLQLGQDHFSEKLKTFEKIYPQLPQSRSPLRSIDLRYKNKAIIQ